MNRPSIDWTLAAIAGVVLLAGCGQSGVESTEPVAGDDPTTPGGTPADPAFARYALANGCFGVQDTASGRFLATDAAGNLAFTGESQPQAAAFFLKASGLGRYLFYDTERRFMSLDSGNEAAADAGSDAAGEAGSQIAGIGDVVAVAGPNNPISDGLNDAGGAIGGAGDMLADPVNANRSFVLADAPSDGSEWIVDVAEAGDTHRFTVVSRETGESLAVVTDDGVSDTFHFVATDGCTPYPEAELNATGTPFSGTNPDGSVFGYAETHMHLGGSEALGGRLGYGQPFHRFGITHALDNCEADHGPGGNLDALDVFVNPQRTTPPHDTQGWPTFTDWPAYGSQTHHQTYYMWLKRAWMGGLRFMVNHLVANEVLCQTWPLKENDCNEMDSIRLQRDLVLDLIDYIDAQEGGPGRGFLRDVYSSTEAREVIENGKIAMIFGTENEKIFDCGEYLGMPECTTQHIDEQMDLWYEMGLRSIFPIHLFDNALGGARINDDPALQALYSAGNIQDTGHPYATIPCEEADATEPGEAPVQDNGIFAMAAAQLQGPPPVPPLTGCTRNARGLTQLGDYFVNALVDHGIIIEGDHAGALARKRYLDIAAARNVAVVSGHAGPIGPQRDTRRVLGSGGVISYLTDEPAPVWLDFIQRLSVAYADVHGSTAGFSTGMGADINGIHQQPAPRPDAADNPLTYPFTSYDGQVTFQRQVTGERVFDLNIDGVAHYGLYPDYIADLQREPGGERALEYLFRSAEAYIRIMERAEAARDTAHAGT